MPKLKVMNPATGKPAASLPADDAKSVAAKYQREFGTENGPEGDRFWIQFVVPIGQT